MSLSPLHRYLVQRSFTTLATHIETTTLFNRRLLDLNPTRSWLFGDDTIAQPERLLHLLALAVAFIDQPALLTVWTVETWKRYQHYGITETDLQLVSEALLWVIEHELERPSRLKWAGRGRDFMRCWPSVSRLRRARSLFFAADYHDPEHDKNFVNVLNRRLINDS